ncbi:hypothetical protein L596_002574 [Steinernema carpocapsae]|nr:hypothetical protein L596_002574 [Steinernema carpocapsae]
MSANCDGAILFVDETASSEAIFSMESQNQITLLDMNPLSVINWDKFTPETPVAIRPEHFDLRPYQEELAHHALKGENTIIWAPTGSGKTIVAVHVIAQHLLKGNGRKVCFVVPNVTLLEQQKRVCERHMDAKVNIIKAESKAPFSGMVAASHIVLLTPQMLVNALQNTTEGKENFSLSVFSMIVLDECHHTAESHPYNVLMHHYHDVKLKGTGKSPQIVGLTASLGAGTSRNANEAFRHIQKLCANLDSPKISTVEKHKADLTGFAVETKDRIRYVESNYRSKPFFKDVMELMSELENGIFVHPAIACDPVKKAMIKEQVCRSSDASSTANYRSSASTRYSQAYQNWLGNALMITLPKVDLPSDARVEIMTRFRLLKILYKMIELWANFNGKCAMDYYMKESEGLPIPLPVHDRIRELVSYRNDNSDMLIEMCQLLVEKFGEGTDGASPARVLIFVKEREYTYMLANIIDCCNELKALGVRPDFLISTNSGDGECRLNPEEQRSKLEKFRSGEINLLCSTSVAEEGLDVAECNLVIKYNYASSDIAHVQRRGRARHQNSYAVLFTHDKNLEQQENKNILSEELSNQAIALLRQMPQKMFEAEVQELVRKSYSDRVIERAAKETASLALKDVGARYDILCRTCTEFIGRSTDVRHSNHSLHILCDGSIWDRFTCEESVSQENFLKTSELPIGKIYCNNCKEVWGRIVIFKGIAVPIIACKGILLQNARGERFPCAKWAGIKGRYFCPEEVKSVDLARLSAAPHRPQFLTVLMGETESRSL